MNQLIVDTPRSIDHLPLPRTRRAPAPGRRCIAVGLIGPGRVGRVLLEQIRDARERLAQELGLEIVLRGTAASQVMYIDDGDHFAGARRQGPFATQLDAFAEHVRGDGKAHALLIDCTASSQVVDHYAAWLRSGIHIVTPNKHAGSGPMGRWADIGAAQAQGARFRQEATVGAGLPILHTMRDLLDTGDQLLAVDGMFSGTLAWLCNRFVRGTRFSELVREAHALGYTEPDPRDDLSGMDVARKLVILAREAGWRLSLEHVDVQSLIPAELTQATPAQFLQQLEALDAPMSELLERAHAEGKVLRYVASLRKEGRATVALQAMSTSHAFAHTQLTDNVVQFRTERYKENPLQVQGPGAGPEVTAGGIFADILRIAESLQATSAA
ncbi:homoserine dehydrogenase [Dyella acidiphila]|uniref:Homoserine dehydrogenase n=1 Tax=Dyella acidiphila TaxID=2775866 RepID=A0ABR9GDA1_9GAMM|nr:homoserine dehydrogenase [Dyella acidiphila]MBE1162007.1 homoserine dehydrogenase [Dyella acidiphila]